MKMLGSVTQDKSEIGYLESALNVLQLLDVNRSYSIHDLSRMGWTVNVCLLFDGIEQIPGMNVLFGFAAVYGCLESFWEIDPNGDLPANECCEEFRGIIADELRTRIQTLHQLYS